MKVQGFTLEGHLTQEEKDVLRDECIGCLNRICITNDKEEVLTMLTSLQYKAILLGKSTFHEIDEATYAEEELETMKVL